MASLNIERLREETPADADWYEKQLSMLEVYALAMPSA